MSNYQKYTLKERKAWGKRMQEAKAQKLHGYGDYSKSKKEKGIGEKIGGTIGAGLGKGIHLLVKHLTGFGDYEVEENTLLHGGLTPPEIVNASAHGGVIVRHREYLGDINATTAFTLQNYFLNPGLNTSFPWLSSVAANFEQYRWRGVVFEFKSLSSDAVLSSSTSSALGAVIMATEYNTLNPNFADKSEMENHEFGNSRKPSCNFLHPVECKGSLTSVERLYVRTGAVPSTGDQRLYDLGNFQIATVGMQAASGVAGELWVTYEVEFYKPQLPSGNNPVGTEVMYDHFNVLPSSGSSSPFGTSGPINPISTSNLGGQVTIGAANVGIYNFPPEAVGNSFLIAWVVRGSSTGTIVDPSYTPTSLTALNIFEGSSQNAFSCPTTSDTVASYRYISLQAFTVQAVGAKLQVGNNGTLPASFVRNDLYVISLPTGVKLLADMMKDTMKEGNYPVLEARKDDDKSIEDDDEVLLDVVKYFEKKGIKLVKNTPNNNTPM